MTQNKTVAVVGASADRSKFGNKSVRAHASRGWTVYPVNPRGGTIEGLKTYVAIDELPKGLDRVTLYVSPAQGIKLLPEIVAIRPKELYLNPGTASPELIAEAQRVGLNPVQGCSIIDIGATPAEFPD